MEVELSLSPDARRKKASRYDLEALTANCRYNAPYQQLLFSGQPVVKCFPLRGELSQSKGTAQILSP